MRSVPGYLQMLRIPLLLLQLPGEWQPLEAEKNTGIVGDKGDHEISAKQI